MCSILSGPGSELCEPLRDGVRQDSLALNAPPRRSATLIGNVLEEFGRAEVPMQGIYITDLRTARIRDPNPLRVGYRLPYPLSDCVWLV
jgi:hypothetical protein